MPTGEYDPPGWLFFLLFLVEKWKNEAVLYDISRTLHTVCQIELVSLLSAHAC